MAAKTRPIRLTAHFNSDTLLRPSPDVLWTEGAAALAARVPRGPQKLWGIPFRLGPRGAERKGMIVVCGERSVRVPLSGLATHVCLLHFCNHERRFSLDAAGGEHLADYVLCYADGTEHVQPIKRRFEINSYVANWGYGAFGAVRADMPRPLPEDPQRHSWGWIQAGVPYEWPDFATWVYALENPHADKRIRAIEFRARSQSPVAVLGITLYQGEGHPLRHLPRRVYRLLLPPGHETPSATLSAELDMGVVTRVYTAPVPADEEWLRSPDAGLGAAEPPDEPRRDHLIEATGAVDATLTVKAGDIQSDVPIGEVYRRGAAESEDGAVRVEILNAKRTWVHVTVVDGETGQPTPARIHFRSKHGEYLPPYGHQQTVNVGFFEDYGGDLRLGETNYAYVPGKFQIQLPVGDVYVEMSKGFEYTPVRRKLRIEPGQTELGLRLDRWTNLRQQGWITADTHVHFISPQTAWLEAQCEGLNLINLLAAQIGRLYTNVGDLTGELSGCSTADTLVWVGTENRHHLLGHISLLGGRGEPVFPMSCGGPEEAYFGDPDMFNLTEWAERCREREGLVIRPHFPYPMCEEPVYIGLDKLDAVEVKDFASASQGTLEGFSAREWYRYLNCGHRIAAVGGTDKMCAATPVGAARTYAQLRPGEELRFDNWARAVRGGRTFTTSGPLIALRVDGSGVGDQILMPANGGTLEIKAIAESAWPMHLLEVVWNGRVVASASSAAGSLRLSLCDHVKVTGSGWMAARCGSELRIHQKWGNHVGAHTSPIYVIAGGQEVFSPSDASYMLTLIEGGLTYLDTLSIREDEERHAAMRRAFEQARESLHTRLHSRGYCHRHDSPP